MRLLCLIVGVLGWGAGVRAAAPMDANEIALALLCCRPFPEVSAGDNQGAKELLEPLIAVAKNDPATIREGLRVLQTVLESPGIRNTHVYNNVYLTVPVLFKVMFRFPSGRLRDMPETNMSFLPWDGKEPDMEKVVEYSLPIAVDSEGNAKLEYAMGGFAGLVGGDFVAMLDQHLKDYHLRTIPGAIRSEPMGSGH